MRDTHPHAETAKALHRPVSDEDRRAYEAYYSDDESYLEIGLRTNRSEGWVESAVERVREEKRHRMAARGMFR